MVIIIDLVGDNDVVINDVEESRQESLEEPKLIDMSDYQVQLDVIPI